MFKRLIRTKTFWTSVMVVLAVMESLVTGRVTWAEALHIAATAILAIFIRDGIAKNTKLEA